MIPNNGPTNCSRKCQQDHRRRRRPGSIHHNINPPRHGKERVKIATGETTPFQVPQNCKPIVRRTPLWIPNFVLLFTWFGPCSHSTQCSIYYGTLKYCAPVPGPVAAEKRAKWQFGERVSRKLLLYCNPLEFLGLWPNDRLVVYWKGYRHCPSGGYKLIRTVCFAAAASSINPPKISTTECNFHRENSANRPLLFYLRQ